LSKSEIMSQELYMSDIKAIIIALRPRLPVQWLFLRLSLSLYVECVVEIIFYYCTTPPSYLINRLKPGQLLTDAFVLFISLTFLFPQETFISIWWLFKF